MPKRCIDCAYYLNDFCCYMIPYLRVPTKYKARFHKCGNFYPLPIIENKLPRDEKGRFVKRS